MAESDKKYELYHRGVKRRFRLKDIHIAEAYMRGSDPTWVGVKPEDVRHARGMIGVVLTYGTATLTGSIEPIRVEDMLAEWIQQIADHPSADDPRKFTRRIIAEHLALNLHRDRDKGEILLCGAIWLATTHEEHGSGVLNSLKRGDVQIRYDITDDDQHERRRFRLSVEELPVIRG
jgi:hypothetical protein